MLALIKILPLILQAFLTLILNPMFWLIVVFIGLQYRRVNMSKKRLFGITDEPVWQHTLMASFHGILGGLLGSFLMVLAGISINNIGIGLLWLVAIFLMFISPRFLCFSYAGTILSISHLIFGVPNVEIPQLMGLVAILHLVESFLIFISGHLGAIPVYTKNASGQTVGAFSMQKFWPIPIVALMIMERVHTGGNMVNMPEWWPLIKPLIDLEKENVIYAILPVLAGLGYGDLAITIKPEYKSRRSAAILSVYSVILLSLAIIASKVRYLSILPALFGAVGHEITIWIGRKAELEGTPFYVSPTIGVKVLDVVRNSVAGRMGIRSGDIIYSINGIHVNNRYQFQEALNLISNFVEFEYIKAGSNKIYREVQWIRSGEKIGIIPVPEPDDNPQVSLTTQGILLRWIKRYLDK